MIGRTVTDDPLVAVEPYAATIDGVAVTHRWRCRYVDGEFGEHTAWHYDKDDTGFGSSWAEAFDGAMQHTLLHLRAGRVPPLPGFDAVLYRARHRARAALTGGPGRVARLRCRLWSHNVVRASDGWYCAGCGRSWS